MPLSDVAQGHFDETLDQAKESRTEFVSANAFGICQGILIHALYSKEISHEEHRALSDNVSKAMREWREKEGERA